MRRFRGIPNDVYGLNQKSIGRAKYTTYIISAADIFQHHYNRMFFRLLHFLHRFSAQLGHAQFAHGAKLANECLKMVPASAELIRLRAKGRNHLKVDYFILMILFPLGYLMV
jgi:hypothetical protein